MIVNINIDISIPKHRSEQCEVAMLDINTTPSPSKNTGRLRRECCPSRSGKAACRVPHLLTIISKSISRKDTLLLLSDSLANRILLCVEPGGLIEQRTHVLILIRNCPVKGLICIGIIQEGDHSD